MRSKVPEHDPRMRETDWLNVAVDDAWRGFQSRCDAKAAMVEDDPDDPLASRKRIMHIVKKRAHGASWAWLRGENPDLPWKPRSAWDLATLVDPVPHRFVEPFK